MLKGSAAEAAASKFVYENPNSTRKERQTKVKEYLDNYHPHSRGSHYFTYDSEHF